MTAKLLSKAQCAPNRTEILGEKKIAFEGGKENNEWENRKFH